MQQVFFQRALSAENEQPMGHKLSLGNCALQNITLIFDTFIMFCKLVHSIFANHSFGSNRYVGRYNS